MRLSIPAGMIMIYLDCLLSYRNFGFRTSVFYDLHLERGHKNCYVNRECLSVELHPGILIVKSGLYASKLLSINSPFRNQPLNELATCCFR